MSINTASSFATERISASKTSCASGTSRIADSFGPATAATTARSRSDASKKRTNARPPRRRAPRADARASRRTPPASAAPPSNEGTGQPGGSSRRFCFSVRRFGFRIPYSAARRAAVQHASHARRRSASSPPGASRRVNGEGVARRFVLRRFVFRPTRESGVADEVEDDARPSATRRAREARDSGVRDVRRGRGMRRATNRGFVRGFVGVRLRVRVFDLVRVRLRSLRLLVRRGEQTEGGVQAEVAAIVGVFRRRLGGGGSNSL